MAQDPIREPATAQPVIVEPIPEAVLAEPTEVVVVEEQPQIVLVNRPRKVYSGMWGVPEIAAVSISTLVVVLVLVVYFFWVIPSSRELARNKSEADRLESEMISAKSKYGEITDSESQVGKLVASVDDFETRFLPSPTTGQAALYQRLNGLIAAYGLVNTSGPDYAPLETSDSGSQQQQSSEDEKGRARFKSLYPGVYVSTTLEGSYQNLRRFIREVETGRDFIVVSTVELAPSDTENQQKKEPVKQSPVRQMPNTGVQMPMGPQNNPTLARPPQGMAPGFNPQPMLNQQPQMSSSRARPQGKSRGEVVSLRIELAAYFRRPDYAPAVVTGQQ